VKVAATGIACAEFRIANVRAHARRSYERHYRQVRLDRCCRRISPSFYLRESLSEVGIGSDGHDDPIRRRLHVAANFGPRGAGMPARRGHRADPAGKRHVPMPNITRFT
jgi:hypothetical protein